MFMNLKPRDWPTICLWAATVAAAAIASVLLWGAGLLRDGGHFLALDDLEHVGAFIGGIFTPLAVGWAARSFVLQRQQMIDTIAAMAEQNDLQRQMLMQATEQIAIDRQMQMEAMDPLLQIIPNGSSVSGGGARYGLKIINHRGIAQRLSISYELTGPNGSLRRDSLIIASPLGSGEFKSLDIAIPPTNRVYTGAFEVKLIVLAERLDRRVSRYIFKGDNSMNLIRESAEMAVPNLVID